jgi:hypothetical protein
MTHSDRRIVVGVDGVRRVLVCAPHSALERLRLNFTAGAALTHHTHEEVAEAVIEPLDVGKHAHGRMVLRALARVYSVRAPIASCMLRLAQKVRSSRKRFDSLPPVNVTWPVSGGNQ